MLCSWPLQPAGARMLASSPYNHPSEEEGEGARGRGDSPLDALLRTLGEGLGFAAGKVGEALCHLGNYLRGLGEELRTALAGMGPAEGSSPGRRPDERALKSALAKIALGVVVVLLIRRMPIRRRLA